MKRVWDITRKLRGDLAPWPGDEPFRFRWSAQKANGSSVNLGAISLSVHNGTHADAPVHFINGGMTIEQVPLETYFGKVAVIDLSAKFSGARGAIEISDLASERDEIAETQRLFLKTNCCAEATKFPEWIPVLAPAAIEWLAETNVILLGVDVPSVDALDSKALENHHALHRGNIAIIESLDLRAVNAGTYQFSALPLPIEGADGSPLRAILWRD